MDFWDSLRDRLLDLSQESWSRDIFLLLAVTLISYLPARLISGYLRRRSGTEEGSDSTGRRSLRAALDAAVWPAVSILVLGALDAVLTWLRPDHEIHLLRVLPVLGFFLLYRCVNAVSASLTQGARSHARIRFVLLPLIFIAAALQQLGVLDDLFRWSDRPLVTLGERAISLASITLAILLIAGFIALARFLGRILGTRVLPGMGFDRSLSEALGTVIRYALIGAGFFVALDTLGVDLSTLQIGLGALGVGIGFGLQDLVQNFASGLILLFEGTIKRGDIVSVEGDSAKVLRIGLRSSVVRNRKGHEVVVPNSMLTANPVINFSLSDSLVRIDLPVGVSYDSDPRQVESILIEAADEHEEILKRPNPRVFFMNYGESSIDFELRCWLDDEMKHPQVHSDLLFSVWYKLEAAGIVIPFPQRDLHLKSGSFPFTPPSAEQDPERPLGGGEIG